MDATYLQRAARLVWGSQLSSLLERRARQATRKHQQEDIHPAPIKSSGSKRQVSTPRTLSCPKCSVLWIPGLTALARVRRHAGHKAHNRSNNSLILHKMGKNKRAKSRARKNKKLDSRRFEDKLKSKMGTKYVSESERMPPRFLHYTCRNDCSGYLILPLQTQQQRKIEKPMQKRTINLADETSSETAFMHRPKPHQHLSAIQKPPGSEPPNPTAKTGGRLNLRDFML